jgi:hypothetical protein
VLGSAANCDPPTTALAASPSSSASAARAPTIAEFVAGHNPEALLADGFEDAFIGVVLCKGREPVALYDHDKCVQIIMKQGCCQGEAEEFFGFNVTDAYVGHGTPAFLVRPDGSD